MNVYLEMKSLNNKFDEKIKIYENVDKEILKINDAIERKEEKINEEINKIKDKLEKMTKLIKIENVFDEYKSDLMKKIDEDEEYKEFNDIYNTKNINDFTIDELYTFLNENLKDYSFSLSKKDITNYNLFIEIIKNYPQLYSYYKDDIDVDYEI